MEIENAKEFEMAEELNKKRVEAVSLNLDAYKSLMSTVDEEEEQVFLFYTKRPSKN